MQLMSGEHSGQDEPEYNWVGGSLACGVISTGCKLTPVC